jgi:hypothetical protein
MEVRLIQPEPDEAPGTLFFACVAIYQGPFRFEVGSATSPRLAAERLLDALMDGGQCTHCHRTTGVMHNLEEGRMAKQDSPEFCWWTWNPKLKAYSRGCAGDPELN